MSMSLVLSTIGILVVAIAVFVGCSSTFGTRPSEADRLRFSQSPNYNKETGKFVNQDQVTVDKMNDRMTFMTMVKLQFQSVKDAVPTTELPSVRPDLKEFLAASEDVKVIWFGHSTLLFNVNGKIILVDPVFSNFASPFSFMIKRFQPPVLKIEELPEIDYVLISHDHYDHLDIDSIKKFVDKKTPFIVPLGVGGHLKGWGIDSSRITELDWWQKYEAGGISFVATPAQHFSGRLRRNETLWTGFIIQNEKHKIYYSGDTGYNEHFKEIAKRHGPFDVAFIELGQYNELWAEIHLLPEQAVQAFFDLKAKQYFPVHWGAFNLGKHSWYDPIAYLSKASEEKKFNLLTPKLGEVVKLKESTKTEKWW